MSDEITCLKIKEKCMIENFDKLSFNRKVDVLVAVHVFNIKNITIDFADEIYWKVCVKSLMREDHISCYSTLLTSTWDIVRKFDYLYLFRSKDFKNGQWECKLLEQQSVTGNFQKDVYYAWAETEQLAICYAGLKAVGFDVKSFLKEEGKVHA